MTAYELRISDWSSDVCSSDLPQTPSVSHAASHPSAGRKRRIHPNRGSGGTNVPVSRDVRRVRGMMTGHHVYADPPTRIVHMGNGGVKGLSPRLMEIGRAACRDRVCQYV